MAVLLTEAAGQHDGAIEIGPDKVIHLLPGNKADRQGSLLAGSVDNPMERSALAGDALDPFGDFIGASQVEGLSAVALARESGERGMQPFLVARSENDARA